ncbi:hypothetical protein Bca4012_011795 [Brassica carinata]|uniref:Uncharacterized protein n=1 Tax=Brassica carinata TaxID=52824 RepID=A0A8X7S9V3_BRACI|nr:hypothetical protein Bca52824_036676 [Brassica carinata]
MPVHMLKSHITGYTRHPISTSKPKLTRLAGEDETTVVSPDHAGARTTAPIFVVYILPTESFIGTIPRSHPEPSKTPLTTLQPQLSLTSSPP